MTIGIWGDSIVYGSCDQEGLGWVGRLRKDFPEDDWTSVYNRGVCGDTSSDLLKRFPIEIASIKPEVVIFAFGINDSAYRGEESNNLVSLEEAKDNLRKLINLAKSSTHKIYVVGLTDVSESYGSSMDPSFSNTVIRKYDDGIKMIAEEFQVPFINVQGVLADTDLADGLHPNAQGYEKLYKVISANSDF